MFRRRLSRSLGIVALSLSLSASLAVASPDARPKAQAIPTTSVWTIPGTWLADAMRKVGCLIAPWGSCSSNGGDLPTSDYGCGIDPGGVPHCTPTNGEEPSSEYGCSIDPGGHCR